MVSIKTKQRTPNLNIRVLEEARDAVARLRALKPLLSLQDEETLSLLIDKQLLTSLEKSLREAQQGKVEPLGNILK
ncbi:MAG: hypothetical protein AAB482_02490 [Patescibacteria group bacterium]